MLRPRPSIDFCCFLLLGELYLRFINKRWSIKKNCDAGNVLELGVYILPADSCERRVAVSFMEMKA
jgi:hypothetical protein